LSLLTVNIKKNRGRFNLNCQFDTVRQITAIFGISGSGKSTILNCVAGFLKPDDGLVQFGNEIFYSRESNIEKPPNKRRIGYVTQDTALFPHMSVRKNIEYGFDLTPLKDRKFDLSELIDSIGVESLLDMYPQALSGGERQRVALARSLATSPDLLLLDEPLASIDVPSRGGLLKLLKESSHEFRIPMLYVSHSVSEVIALADQVVVISEGKVVEEGEPQILFNNPRLFSGSNREVFENLIEGELVDFGNCDPVQSVFVCGHIFYIPPITHPRSPKVMISIRSTDIIISKGVPVSISARNIIPSVIENYYIQEDIVLLNCDIGINVLVEITRHSFEELMLEKDMKVFLVIKSGNMVAVEG
jgi:molybdate transport system ATP-binding protein